MFYMLNFPFNLLSEVIRAEAETCFEIRDENKYSNVTFAFDDIRFSAQKGPSNPKHNKIKVDVQDILK